MKNAKRFNLEDRLWKGISYKKGGERIVDLRQKALLKDEFRVETKSYKEVLDKLMMTW